MINYLQLQPAAGGLICPYRAEAVSLSAKTPYLIGDVTFAFSFLLPPKAEAKRGMQRRRNNRKCKRALFPIQCRK